MNFLRILRSNHGLWLPKEAFFIKISDFWDGADKFWGIFGQFISTHFGTVSPLSMFPLFNHHFYKKLKPLYLSTSQKFIWDWDLNLGRKELGI